MFIRYVTIFFLVLELPQRTNQRLTFSTYLRHLNFSVGLSFLLSIACLAETLPTLNKFIQLAPYPTKSSKVGLLRLLLLNVSGCYFIEYFCTLIFRNDVWKERNKTFYHPSCTGRKLAADEEEKLLVEERKQNSILVYFLCLIMLNFSLKIF